MSGPGNPSAGAGSSAPNTVPSAGATPTPASGAKPTPTTASPSGGGAQARATGTAPTTPPAREPRLIKHQMADGSEIDIDIAEHLEAEFKNHKRKMKVGNKEREVSLSEAFERFPLAEGARERFEEAAKIRKDAETQRAQIEKLGEILKKPETARGALIRLMGQDNFYAMAESVMAEQLKYEQMNAQERQAFERQQALDSKYQTREQQLAAREQQIKQQEARALEVRTNEIRKQYEQQFPIHLKAAGVPVTPRTMAMFAEAKRDALRLKMPHTDADIAKQVGTELRELTAHYSQALAPEELRTQLGPAADKLRQAEVDRVAAQPGRRVSGQKPTSAANSSIPQQIKTPDQYRRHLAEQDAKAEREWRNKR